MMLHQAQAAGEKSSAHMLLTWSSGGVAILIEGSMVTVTGLAWPRQCANGVAAYAPGSCARSGGPTVSWFGSSRRLPCQSGGIRSSPRPNSGDALSRHCERVGPHVVHGQLVVNGRWFDPNEYDHRRRFSVDRNARLFANGIAGQSAARSVPG